MALILYLGFMERGVTFFDSDINVVLDFIIFPNSIDLRLEIARIFMLNITKIHSYFLSRRNRKYCTKLFHS